jgi:hypothetical protein
VDFDRVVVMDRGEVVEVGVPGMLLEAGGSRFGELYFSGESGKGKREERRAGEKKCLLEYRRRCRRERECENQGYAQE